MKGVKNDFCIDCGVKKTEKNCYKNKNYLQSRCKKCSHACNRAYIKKVCFWKNEQRREKYNYAYRKNILDKYRANNKEKLKARYLVAKAVKNGFLEKKFCEDCGAKKVEAHHYRGYSEKFSLTVQWLCYEHHKKRHYKSLQNV